MGRVDLVDEAHKRRHIFFLRDEGITVSSQFIHEVPAYTSIFWEVTLMPDYQYKKALSLRLEEYRFHRRRLVVRILKRRSGVYAKEGISPESGHESLSLYDIPFDSYCVSIAMEHTCDTDCR